MNNLYGGAMCEKLPLDNFKFNEDFLNMSIEEVELFIK